MAIVDLATFKEYLGTELSRNDELLQLHLNAAEDAVRRILGRNVALATGTPAARTFRPSSRYVAEVDDFVSLTSVADDGTTVSASYRQLEPVGQRFPNGDTAPYHLIRHIGGGWSRSTVNEATLTVTANWGWASIPDAIKLAVLMMGKDLREAQNTAYGVAAYTEYNAVRIRENPVILDLLADYRRQAVLIA